ncbi:HTTM domain-containing protein, partial [Leucobacter sp. M11]|uniref:HTTM domain-containing protein n=1 Tax=Leucobacter sp. M11 TaxID=2993565 RepID=UPI002D7E9AD9
MSQHVTSAASEAAAGTGSALRGGPAAWFGRFARWVTEDKRATYGASALRILFALSMLTITASSFFDRHYLWGIASTWVDPEVRQRGWWAPFTWFFPKDNAVLFDLSYGVLLALIILFLIGWKTRYVTPVLLLFWMGLVTNSTVLTNGGDTITRIVLLFMIFADLSRHWSVDAWLRKRSGREPHPLVFFGKLSVPAWLRNTLHNVAVMLAGYQIILVYVNSGIYKLMGEEWRDGSAFYYSLVLDVFRSFPVLNDLAWQSTLFVQVATWLSVWVQVLFPLLLLWTPTRRFAILFIMSMHFGIGVFQGLWSFSLVMLGCDLLFVRDRSWRYAGTLLRNVWRRLVAFFRRSGAEPAGAAGGRAPEPETRPAVDRDPAPDAGTGTAPESAAAGV